MATRTKSYIDTIIENADRMSGGAPSISGGQPVDTTYKPPVKKPVGKQGYKTPSAPPKKTVTPPVTPVARRPTPNLLTKIYQDIKTPQVVKDIAIAKSKPITYTSGREIQHERILHVKTGIKQITDIDPSAQYQLKSGEIISGESIRKDLATGIRSTALGIPKIQGGQYIKKGETYYKVSPEMQYVLKHADKPESTALYKSIGQPKGTPQKGFIGPVYDPFAFAFIKAYESLSGPEKITYGFTYHPFTKDVPVEEWQYQPGGKEYLKTHKQQSIESYIKQVGGPSNVPISMHKFAATGYAGAMENYKYKPEFIRSQSWDILTIPEGERRQHYFGQLPKLAQVWSSTFHATVSGAAFPVTLPQAVVKLTTGKTHILPDIGEKIQKYQPGGPSGLISTGIGEGIGALTGKETDAWERFMKHPMSGIAATGGELFGMWMGGKAIHGAKVGTIKGLGRVSSGVTKYTGVKLPSYAQISYHYPTRAIRRWGVQKGTKNIGEYAGKPYHATETLTKKGLSYAPGKTKQARVKWTLEKTDISKDIAKKFGLGDKYLLGSSSGERIGAKFVIKAKAIHELPALSTTPYGYAPTRFYRFGATNLSYSSGTSLFPKMHLPSGFAIDISKIFKAPGQTYDDIIKWAATQPKGKWGVISPKMYMGGPEAEINIFGKTILKRFIPGVKNIGQRIRGYKYYADVPLQEVGYFSGKPLIEKAPIVFTSPIHKGFPTGAKLLFDNQIANNIRKALSSSSYSGVVTPVVSPGYLISKALSSGVISKPYVPSSSISIPSYPSMSSISSQISKSISKSYSKISSSSYPSYPSKPSYPSYPSKPSMPSIPSYPSIPSIPSYSSKPSVPSAPSYPSYPSKPIVPSIPSYHSYPIPPPIMPIYPKKKKVPGDMFDFVLPKYRFREFKIPSLKKLLGG